jgi:hypothetical protein
MFIPSALEALINLKATEVSKKEGGTASPSLSSPTTLKFNALLCTKTTVPFIEVIFYS